MTQGEQMTLTDLSKQARDEGMDRVDRAAPLSWKVYADAFIDLFLRAHRTMHCDELWDAGLSKPPELRALGPRFQAAARAGKMRKTGRMKKSYHSHMTEKPVWESLIYEDG